MTIDKLKTDGESVIIIEGHVEFVPTEVIQAAHSAGRPSGTAFEDALKDELVHQLGIDKTVPPSHNVFACVMTLVQGSQFRSWDFSMIAVSRFA